jgi:hypothetical protein
LFGASINHVKQWLKAYSFFDVLKVDESKERRIIEVKVRAGERDGGREGGREREREREYLTIGVGQRLQLRDRERKGNSAT